MMSHRKAYSEGSVPFSWEHSPGVSKFYHLHNHQKIRRSDDAGKPSINNEYVDDGKKLLPPPPLRPPRNCGSDQPPTPSRSSSSKFPKDPFLAALKECRKGVDDRKDDYKKKKGIHNKSWSKNNKLAMMFSCKHSCEVKTNEDANDVGTRSSRRWYSSVLPPLPLPGDHHRTKERHHRPPTCIVLSSSK